MKILVLTPNANTPGVNPKTGVAWTDYTGAFRPEAEDAATVWRAQGHEIVVARFDRSLDMATRFGQLLAILAVNPGLDAIAYFGHGWKTGLQCGLELHVIPAFAETVRRFSPKLVWMAWYACSAGGTKVLTKKGAEAPGGDGGIADMTRDALCRAGVLCGIWAHTVEGHCTHNPRVRLFPPSPAGGVGGEWAIAPDDRYFVAWTRALAGGMRFAFPFMTLAEIRADVTS